MTHVMINKPAGRSFNNLMDDFLTQVPSILRDEFVIPGQKQQVPVNIRETATDYILDLVAPGMEKEDFQISLDKRILTISVEKSARAEELKEGKLIRKEYGFPSFKRSFTLDEKIDAGKIAAKYLNGVLTLNLPKQMEVKEAAKQISVQ